MQMCDFNIAIEFISALPSQAVHGKPKRYLDVASQRRVTEATLQLWSGLQF
jgi:hypothetical protein